MERSDRRKNLERFRHGGVTTHVNLPRQLDNYLHRAGRTARAGRDGMVNLVTQRDQTLLAKVEKVQRRST